MSAAFHSEIDSISNEFERLCANVLSKATSQEQRELITQHIHFFRKQYEAKPPPPELLFLRAAAVVMQEDLETDLDEPETVSRKHELFVSKCHNVQLLCRLLAITS
jgi:hypothetical protein